MPVGASVGSNQVDNILSALAIQLRDACRQIYNLNLAVNGQAAGLAYLESIGYSGTANPANPGSISDAQLALNMIAVLNTVAGLYFGTATQATTFNFDQQLSALWAGRVASGF
jgi:hypothetical protein